ncbi:protein BTG1 [Engraulis encrasicolus]|uniref:protein BTG1 n=1 Tax=Engraulis encrasicolus TaxID=184585 RepID=UPI002FD2D66C
MHTLCARGTMKPEITAAVGFLSRFLRIKGQCNDRQLQTFSQTLQDILAEQYKHHWFPDRPNKGSGYRCIRINHKMDPLVGQAAQRIGLTIQQLYVLLPSELTLWVDPFEVSYRIGEDGSICVLYESQPAVTTSSGSGTSTSNSVSSVSTSSSNTNSTSSNNNNNVVNVSNVNNAVTMATVHHHHHHHGHHHGHAPAMTSLVDSHISCKEELLLVGRSSPPKGYSMMTVSS